jgi:hypothetical protein
LSHQLFQATFRAVLDPKWLGLQPVRLGYVPPGIPSPALYVLVEKGDEHHLRIDLYAHSGDCHAFQEAIIWRQSVLIGFGHHVYCVRLGPLDVSNVDLGSYFGHFYALDDCLLVASAECLLRLEEDGRMTWKTTPLGIDGVVIHRIADGIVEGEGEWDPPGGWRPFRIRLGPGLLV